jgi:hypothetical protein
MSGAAQPPEKFRSFPPSLAARLVQLPERHADLLADEPNSAVLLERLVQHGLLDAAARLVGYALPEREAVWWACKCVSHTAPAALPPQAEAALSAAEAWVWRPNDAARMKAARAAAEAGYDTAPAWTARAAFASRPAWPLHPRCGRRVERAIALAAVTGSAERREPRLQQFIASGREIARGGGGHLPPRAG